jgi:hypothetical protein
MIRQGCYLRSKQCGGADVGKIKSKGDEALNDEFLLKSNGDEALNNVFSQKVTAMKRLMLRKKL